MRRLHVILLLLLTCTLQAQTSYRFRHYGREQGLSNLNVNCAMQDSRGLLWVGTNIGLNRFDGSRFHTYFASSLEDSHSMPSNSVTALAEDENGCLWVGTNNGLCIFDPQYDSFDGIEEKCLGHGNQIFALKFDPKGRLWVMTDKQLVRYSPSDSSLTTYERPLAQFMSKNGTLWVSGGDGVLYRYDERTDEFTGFDILSKEQVVGSEWINTIVELSDGDLALLTNHLHGYRFSPATRQKHDLFAEGFPPQPTFLHTAIERPATEGSPTLWMGTEDGIITYNLQTGQTAYMHKHFGDPYSLSDNAVHVLLSDREGGVWAGTFFGGMNYVPDEREEMLACCNRWMPTVLLQRKWFVKWLSMRKAACG